MVIKINYTSSDVYVSTSVSPVYVVVNYSAVNNGGGGAIWGGITGTLSDQTDLQDALDDKVPYTGATTNVNLGEFELKAGQVEFDQTPTGTAGVGVMRWNDSDGTVDLGLKGGNVTLQVGQEQILRVVNKTGANLLESQYRAVRIRLAAEGGSQGQRLAVVLAQGNNDTNSTDTIGIVTENITDNQEGFICTSGIVRGINTTGSLQGETWADGDIIYLSPTIPGAITKVKPTAPNHSVILGYVIYAHNVNGKIFVKCDNGYELGELHDVYVPTPSNNDGIFWNTANSRYQNNSIAGVLGYTPISGSGASGQVAYWNGTNSQTGSNNLFWDAANARLGIGTNAPSTTLDIRGKTRIQSSGNAELDIVDGSNFLRLAMGSTQGFVGTLSSHPFGFFTGASKRGEFSTNGNFILQNGGTFTDSGQRLQVQGDAFIKGSGATSATLALLVQNSAGTNIAAIRNDGQTQIIGTGNTNATTSFIVNNSSGNTILRTRNDGSIGLGNDFPELYPTISGAVDISGAGIGFRSGQAAGSTSNYHFYFRHIYTSVGQTSGTQGGINYNIGYNPTSGTGIFNSFLLVPTINQTGGANGITRGLYVNPTLTAAADWRSIEWSNNSGWGLYGAGTANNYLGGALGIGNSSVSTTSIRLFLQFDATRSYGIRSDAPITSGANSSINFSSETRISAAVSTSNFTHYGSSEVSIGAGSSITNHVSFYSGITTGTNVYGFQGAIANGTGRWNLYMNGTADNYLRGKLLINTTTVGTFDLDVNGTARVSGDVSISGVLRETLTTNRQTASYTLALTDNGKLVEMNVATANNLTVPLNSSIAFPIGTKIDVAQYGAGQTTVVATSGVTVRSAGGALKLAVQYSGVTLVKIATDEWYLFGDITV